MLHCMSSPSGYFLFRDSTPNSSLQVLSLIFFIFRDEISRRQIYRQAEKEKLYPCNIHVSFLLFTYSLQAENNTLLHLLKVQWLATISMNLYNMVKMKLLTFFDQMFISQFCQEGSLCHTYTARVIPKNLLITGGILSQSIVSLRLCGWTTFLQERGGDGGGEGVQKGYLSVKG